MQKCWRDIHNLRSLYTFLYNWCFALRPSHYYDTTSFANRLYSHSYSAFGDILYAIELISCIFSCKPMKIDKPCRTFNRWRWLIKADVTSPANSQYLNIYSSIIFNFFLILLTILRNLLSGQFAIRNIYILR